MIVGLEGARDGLLAHHGPPEKRRAEWSCRTGTPQPA